MSFYWVLRLVVYCYLNAIEYNKKYNIKKDEKGYVYSVFFLCSTNPRNSNLREELIFC